MQAVSAQCERKGRGDVKVMERVTQHSQSDDGILLKRKIFVILDQSELTENDLHYNVWTHREAKAWECGRGANRLHIKPGCFDVNCPDQLGLRTCVNPDILWMNSGWLCVCCNHKPTCPRKCFKLNTFPATTFKVWNYFISFTISCKSKF